MEKLVKKHCKKNNIGGILTQVELPFFHCIIILYYFIYIYVLHPFPKNRHTNSRLQTWRNHPFEISVCAFFEATLSWMSLSWINNQYNHIILKILTSIAPQNIELHIRSSTKTPLGTTGNETAVTKVLEFILVIIQFRYQRLLSTLLRLLNTLLAGWVVDVASKWDGLLLNQNSNGWWPIHSTSHGMLPTNGNVWNGLT